MKKALMVLMLFLLIPAIASAEEEKTAQLDEIVVTATKTDREIKEVPTNIAVITEDDIQRIQPTDVMELLRHVPGLVLNSMGGVETTFYASSRGLSPSSRGMLLMIDGVEVNEPTNYITALNIPLNSIERIEIIKSPASVLYGPSAVGGIVNVITKKPSKPVEGQASVLYGSFERKEAAVNMRGLLPDGVYYSINYWWLDTEGYRDRTFLNQNQLMPEFGYCNDIVDVGFFLNVTKTENGFPGGLPLEDYDKDPEEALQPDREGESQQTNFGVKLSLKTGENSLLNFKSYHRTNEWETEDYGFFFTGKPWNWTTEASYQLSVPLFGMDHTFLAGGQYVKIRNSPYFYMDDNFGSMLLSHVSLDSKSYGVFLQDEVRITDQISFNGGIRYDHFSSDYKNLLDDSGSFDNSHDKWSPRLGLTYSLVEELNLFANYSQGIRSVVLARPVFQLTENVDPEKEESLEAGARGLLFDLLEYNLAVFQVTTKDKVVQTNGRYKYENAGEAESKGVEFALGANLGYGLYLGVDYTYLDSKFTDFKSGDNDYDDKRVPLVPRHTFGATADWNTPLFGRISASFRYVDDKYIDRDYSNTYELEDYCVFDLKYAYVFDNLFGHKEKTTLSLAVNNLFDETYAEYGEIDGGLYVPGPVAYPADGQSFFASMSLAF